MANKMINMLFKISGGIGKKRIGNDGERDAAKFLERKGYQILGRNYTTPYGELDLIAKIENVIIFVEVKTRTNDKFGKGYLAVDKHKQKKIIQSASYYCQKFPNALYRFDVVSVDYDEAGKQSITHIENAFTL